MAAVTTTLYSSSISFEQPAKRRPRRAMCVVRSRTFLRVISDKSICRHTAQMSAGVVPQAVGPSFNVKAVAERIRRVDWRRDESAEMRFGTSPLKSSGNILR